MNIEKKSFNKIIRETKNIKSKDLIAYYNLEDKDNNFKNAYNKGIEDAKERFLTFLTVFAIKNNL